MKDCAPSASEFAANRLPASTGVEARQLVRAGRWSRHTGGTAPNHVRRNMAMCRTNIPSVPAGVFHLPMAVSMRPMTAAHAIRAMLVADLLARDMALS